MPVPLILCRLKDDHSVTMMIGETALFHFSEWEPVPEEEPSSDKPVSTEPETPPDKPVAKTRTSKAITAEKDKE